MNRAAIVFGSGFSITDANCEEGENCQRIKLDYFSGQMCVLCISTR